LKKDYFGQILIVIANKGGGIFRRFRFNPCIMNGPLSAIKLDYNEVNLYEITAKWRADAWVEETVGKIEL
jgi:hypothetical protein